MKKKDYSQVVNVDDMDSEAIDRKFEMLSAEGARAMAANFGDPSVDYSKVDFSKPEE